MLTYRFSVMSCSFSVVTVGFFCVSVLSTVEIRISFPTPDGSCQSYEKKNLIYRRML